MRRHFDVKQPWQKQPTPRVVRVPAGLPYIPIKRPVKAGKKYPKIPALATLAIFLSVIILFGLNLLRFKESATNSAPVIYGNFKDGVSALFNFELGKAKDSFQSAADRLANLKEEAPFKTAPAVLGDLFKISQSAAAFSADLENIKTNGLAMLLKKRGAQLIELFHGMRDRLNRVSALSGKLQKQAVDSGYDIGKEFGGFESQLEEARDFLSAFLGWLEAPKKQRLLIFFQNPSEIRPAGGFIGSYAHATLFQGNLLSLEVRDIYDPDGQLDLKIIPPKQLRGVTDSWEARDANWFFDFPTSAKKVIEFLEASKLYSDYGVNFGSAIAVNVAVIEDILKVIGPIELPDYDLTINAENFLSQTQSEVEAGEDKTKGEPKRVLKVLTPIIFEKLSKLDESQKAELFTKLTDRVTAKDIMFYFEDPKIQKFLTIRGVAGAVLELPEDFVGEYLAVANANIAGGKSDVFTRQKIRFEGEIGVNGVSRNRLIIERTHTGQDQKDWWYKAANQSYVQVFVTPGADFKKVSGNTKKVIKPIVDYEKEGYQTDPDLTAYEVDDLVFGKTLFGRWLRVEPGETGRLVFDYASPKRRHELAGLYQFVFEKQSGVDSALEVSLESPSGYQWKENQSRVFEFIGDDLPGRLVLNLNLEKAP